MRRRRRRSKKKMRKIETTMSRISAEEIDNANGLTLEDGWRVGCDVVDLIIEGVVKGIAVWGTAV